MTGRELYIRINAESIEKTRILVTEDELKELIRDSCYAFPFDFKVKGLESIRYRGVPLYIERGS